MRSFAAIAPLALTVAGGVVYHISAKSLPKDASPALVLVVAYAVALTASALVYIAVPNANGDAPLTRALHPAAVAVGLGAAMIEFGYVLTYRAAWPVSIASVLINSMVSVLLVMAGMSIFDERISTTRIIGVALCLAGAWLLRG
jgi:multidrug transporter EmrE-like cation transporter